MGVSIFMGMNSKIFLALYGQSVDTYFLQIQTVITSPAFVSEGIVQARRETRQVLRITQLVPSLCPHRAIFFGKNLTCGSAFVLAREANDVYIGDDNLWSTDIHIRISDGHAILDSQGKCLNMGKDVVVGNHVWLAYDVKLLKGVTVPDGCVVGCGSVVTGSDFQENSVIAGNPAKTLRCGIHWSHRIPLEFKS